MTAVLKAGKDAASEEILLPDCSSIRSLQPEETYKYHGFLEAGARPFKYEDENPAGVQVACATSTPRSSKRPQHHHSHQHLDCGFDMV